MGNAGVPTVRKKVLIFLRKDSGGGGGRQKIFWIFGLIFVYLFVFGSVFFSTGI